MGTVPLTGRQQRDAAGRLQARMFASLKAHNLKVRMSGTYCPSHPSVRGPHTRGSCRAP